MSKEASKESQKYIPVMLCPDCVQEGLQVDPRAKVPAYPVIESICITHLTLRSEIHPLISHPNSQTKMEKVTTISTLRRPGI